MRGNATLIHVQRVALIALLALVAPAAAHADVVAVGRDAPVPRHARPGARALGIWRVPTGERAAGAFARGQDRILHRLDARAAPVDPLEPQEWWLNAVGADRATPPGDAGRVVVVVD